MSKESKSLKCSINMIAKIRDMSLTNRQGCVLVAMKYFIAVLRVQTKILQIVKVI